MGRLFGPARCGIITAFSSEKDPEIAASSIAAQLMGREIQHLLVFFSADRDAGHVARAMSKTFPGVPVCGCSTAGEIARGMMVDESITVIAFPREGFRIVAELVPDIERLTIQRAYDTGRRMRAKFTGTRLEDTMQQRAFAMMLVDGLSNREEMVVAAAHCAAGNVPLIGGSAGDGMTFRRTTLIYDGAVVQDAAILIVVDTDFSFRTFKMQNFKPTPRRLVVTAADTEARVVHELNASPAAREYARAIGISEKDLSPVHFAAYPVVVRAGDDYYCRSIRQVNEDGSLSFFCAIDEGLVLTVAKQQDIISSTRESFDAIHDQIGQIDLVIGFECFLRKIDIENRQLRNNIEEIYRDFKITGFNTYGEQFNAMHLNQTLTGIAFGARRP